MPLPTSLVVLLSVATVIDLASLALVHASRSGTAGRKYFPLYAALRAGLLLGIGVGLSVPRVLLIVVIAVLTLLSYVQLRRLQFCGTCGRTVPRQRPFSEPEFCTRCGTSLRP